MRAFIYPLTPPSPGGRGALVATATRNNFSIVLQLPPVLHLGFHIMHYPSLSKKDLDHAVHVLKTGRLVALPTETVYGLAADARNEAALKKIFAAKGRPSDHPLIVHIATIDQLSDWAMTIPAYAHKLAEHFWPGPMTLILPKQADVLDLVTGGQTTVGIRIPQHPIAQAVLHAFNGGLAAPSANLFGHISPTSAQHVKQSLGEQVDFILDGGPCAVGIESTIIDCTTPQPRILRPGMITKAMIETATQLTINDEHSCAPRVSGALASHYAPRTPTHLLNTARLDETLQQTDNSVVLSRRKPGIRKPGVHWIVMPHDAEAYAHILYEKLHYADQLQCQQLLIEEVPNDPEWQGIQDRLRKASA